MRKGDQYLYESRLAEATLEYRLAVEADPNRGDVRQKLGEAHLRARDASAALREYVRAADLLPADADAQVKAGSLLILAGLYEDAQERARKALAIDPRDAAALVLMGNALAGLKDLEGAIDEFQDAAANTKTEEPYLSIGVVQQSRGKTVEAEAAFRKAIQISPGTPTPKLSLANFLWATGRIAEAEKLLTEALETNPGNLAIRRALGVLLLSSNRMAEAEPHFVAIGKSTAGPEGRLSLATFYVLSRRYDDARKVLTDPRIPRKHVRPRPR